MSYGLKIFNWVEDAEKEFGGVRSFYEAKEVDDYIRSLKADNKRLQKQYLQAVKSANENIAKNVDGNAKYWQDLCERMGNTLVRKMQETFNERMLERIKELVKQRYFHKFLHTDLMSLTTRLKVSVPIFRVDYDYIKISDAEDILR